jgi:DNA adenine methylase
VPYTDSPLRYPGGKTKLAPFVIDLLAANDLFYGHYVEPFAGGAGIAWRLLFSNYVTHIHINDVDTSLHAFWHCALHRTEEFCERIERAEVNMAAWWRHKAVQKQSRPAQLDLAMSTFFINRTSRSGIMDGGVIGGKDQTGNYKIDARYNRSDLLRKIRRIGQYRNQVSLSRLDALEFLRTKLKDLPAATLVNLDPPYFAKGRELYMNHYVAADHAKVAAAVRRLRPRWMVTYDDVPETRALYSGLPQYGHELYYSAQIKRMGVELLVLDPRLTPPDDLSAARRSQRGHRWGHRLQAEV